MDNEEFKKIRQYLNEVRFHGHKWTLPATAEELLRGRSTIFTYESAVSPIPDIVAAKMRELYAQAQEEQERAKLPVFTIIEDLDNAISAIRSGSIEQGISTLEEVKTQLTSIKGRL